jgi:hypothetical protein
MLRPLDRRRSCLPSATHRKLPMRPLLFGYLNGWPSTSDDKLAAFTWQLTAFARTEGFTLHDVFAEQVGGQAAAFRVLVDAVQRHEAEAVAVPALDHLARVPGVPLARTSAAWEPPADRCPRSVPRTPQGPHPRTDTDPVTCKNSGGAEGTRTPDPHTASVVRYQLRHSPAAPSGGASLARVEHTGHRDTPGATPHLSRGLSRIECGGGAQSKTTVLFPCTSTRSSRWNRSPRASTVFSMSLPYRT